MKDYKLSVKITLCLVYVAIAVSLLITIFFPFLVEWFVEKRHKDPALATAIMIIFYPCVPFVAAFLYSLRGLLVNLKKGLVFGDANIRYLKIIAVSCLAAGVIMIIGGFRYMPFWMSGLAAIAGALLSAVIERVFSFSLYKQREVEFIEVREQYEKDDNIGNR